MLPSSFDYIFVHLIQKIGLRPDLSPKFLSTLGPNPTRKALPIYNYELDGLLATWNQYFIKYI